MHTRGAAWYDGGGGLAEASGGTCDVLEGGLLVRGQGGRRDGGMCQVGCAGIEGDLSVEGGEGYCCGLIV